MWKKAGTKAEGKKKIKKILNQYGTFILVHDYWN